jgi:hypothetical protein
MRLQIGIIAAALFLIGAIQTESSAQWRDGARRGLFGERELGRPLKPRQSRFDRGIQRGASGNFQGLSNEYRGTTFRSRARPAPAAPSLIPPEAYDLEPDMVPGFLEEQARRMAAAQQQQAQPLPPIMPQQPERYQPPIMPAQPERSQPPTQPGFPQPQPAVPGPTRQELQSSPDRWFRGAPAPAQPGPPAPAITPAARPQRYAPTPSLGPTGSLGPSGVRSQTGSSRSNPAVLGARINRTLGARVRSPISAAVQGDAVTLQGSVATAADRQLAERMAAMEPGVRQINNRITVQVAPPAP